jgi:tetratricopeptide (TPR) repeat protein
MAAFALASVGHAIEMGGVEKSKGTGAKDQVAFGVAMAQRGLWSEALFRFEQASGLDPRNPSILNNLAVAHEALGLFDQALDLYRQALELDPANRGLKRNYARFVEFYQSFKPPPEEGDDGSEVQGSQGPGTDAAAGDGQRGPP